jgi:potassium-transporting ATPase KdpC subunit
MRRTLGDLGIAVRLTVVIMVLTGLIYPLVMTGAAQALFRDRANGSLLRDQSGNVVGSSLIGQSFTSDKYFHGRPSATVDSSGNPLPYDAMNSSASNLGPTNPALILAVEQNADAVRCAEGLPAGPAPLVTPAPATPTPTPAAGAAATPAPTAVPCASFSQPQQEIPVDAVTASGSGLDPDISVDYAMLQVQRVAKARNMSVDTLTKFVQDNILDRQFGILGERRVNVLDLNLALDAQSH